MSKFTKVVVVVCGLWLAVAIPVAFVVANNQAAKHAMDWAIYYGQIGG